MGRGGMDCRFLRLGAQNGRGVVQRLECNDGCYCSWQLAEMSLHRDLSHSSAPKTEPLAALQEYFVSKLSLWHWIVSQHMHPSVNFAAGLSKISSPISCAKQSQQSSRISDHIHAASKCLLAAPFRIGASAHQLSFVLWNFLGIIHTRAVLDFLASTVCPQPQQRYLPSEPYICDFGIWQGRAHFQARIGWFGSLAAAGIAPRAVGAGPGGGLLQIRHRG